jgi:hypothetical protein
VGIWYWNYVFSTVCFVLVAIPLNINTMATENNMARGQQNALENDKAAYRPDQVEAKEIIDGAQQDVQLKKQEENASKEPFEHHIGTSPSKDTLSQQDIEDGVKTFEPSSVENKALQTKEGKNKGALPAAYKGQKSNHP